MITYLNKADRHKSRAPGYQRQTDRRTDRPTDKAAYRVACTRLKIVFLLSDTVNSIVKQRLFSIYTTCVCDVSKESSDFLILLAEGAVGIEESEREREGG